MQSNYNVCVVCKSKDRFDESEESPHSFFDLWYEIIKVDLDNLITDSKTVANFKILDTVIPGWYCYQCFNLIKKVPIREIKCNNCFEKYESSTPIMMKFGFQCSSCVTPTGLICSYGSKYDCKEYKWIDSIPQHLKLDDVVCDKCLEDFISNKVIKFKQEWKSVEPFC